MAKKNGSLHERTADQVRSLIHRQPFEPFVILTDGGRSFRVKDAASAFIFSDYPDMVVVALRSQGLHVVALRSIEAIQLENEPAAEDR